MLKKIKKIVAFSISFLILIGCSNGESENNSVVNSSTLPEEKQYYGVWSGTLLSSLDGNIENINIIIYGSKIYLSNHDGYTGKGDIVANENSNSATLSLYKHFPVNMFEYFRNPALGLKSDDTILLSLNISDDVVEGSYMYFEKGTINDKGSITTLKKVISDISPTTIGITGTYFNYDFSCDSTYTQSLRCYSYITLTLDSSLNIAGQYSDKFFYSARPNGIPLSIPSSFSFSGSITKIPGRLGMYTVNYTLPNYGDMDGIGYVDAGGLLQYITFSEDGNNAFRIE